MTRPTSPALTRAGGHDPQRVDGEHRRELLRGRAVHVLKDERRAGDVGEHRREPQPGDQRIAGEPPVAAQPRERGQRVAQAAAAPARRRERLAQPCERSAASSTTPSPAEHDEHAPPGGRPQQLAADDRGQHRRQPVDQREDGEVARRGRPVVRSRTTARAITIAAAPPSPAPAVARRARGSTARPRTAREASVNASSPPASTGRRRPQASLTGPARIWPGGQPGQARGERELDGRRRVAEVAGQSGQRREVHVDRQRPERRQGAEDQQRLHARGAALRRGRVHAEEGRLPGMPSSGRRDPRGGGQAWPRRARPRGEDHRPRAARRGHGGHLHRPAPDARADRRDRAARGRRRGRACRSSRART